MDDAQVKLIRAELGRVMDSIDGRLQRIEERLEHHQQLDDEKVTALKSQVADLRKVADDHEQRIRAATDGVIQFKTWSGVSSGASSLFPIFALIKSFLP